MKIYLFDAQTKEFLKETYALLDMEKSKECGEYVYKMPENCTTIEPCVCGNNEVCLFQEGKWIIAKDYRGKKFYDVIKNKTIIIDKLGELPNNYISLDSKDFINHINNTNYEKLYKSIELKINAIHNNKINEDILIGKYYFNLNDLNKYIKAYNEVTSNIKQIEKSIKAIEQSITLQKNVDKINQLKIQQMEKYEEINSFKFNVMLKNKRKKEVEVVYSYNEFRDIINKLQEMLNQINKEKVDRLRKIAKLSKYELVLFEQRLCREGSVNGSESNEKIAKTDSQTS